MQLNSNGFLITRAQASLQNPNLATDFVAITRYYGSLVTIIPRIGNSSFTISEAFYDIMNLDFREYSFQIKPYINQRISTSVMKWFISMERPDISPALLAKLQNALPTTEFIERAFSLVGNVFTGDRPFQPHSIIAHVQ